MIAALIDLMINLQIKPAHYSSVFASMQAVLPVLVCMGSDTCFCTIVIALPLLRMHAKTDSSLNVHGSKCMSLLWLH